MAPYPAPAPSCLKWMTPYPENLRRGLSAEDQSVQQEPERIVVRKPGLNHRLSLISKACQAGDDR